MLAYTRYLHFLCREGEIDRSYLLAFGIAWTRDLDVLPSVTRFCSHPSCLPLLYFHFHQRNASTRSDTVTYVPARSPRRKRARTFPTLFASWGPDIVSLRHSECKGDRSLRTKYSGLSGLNEHSAYVSVLLFYIMQPWSFPRKSLSGFSRVLIDDV